MTRFLLIACLLCVPAIAGDGRHTPQKRLELIHLSGVLRVYSEPFDDYPARIDLEMPDSDNPTGFKCPDMFFSNSQDYAEALHLGRRHTYVHVTVLVVYCGYQRHHVVHAIELAR